MQRFSTVLWALLAAAPATAQVPQVLISEINFTPQDVDDTTWIELINLGGAQADLSGWALYYTTMTPGRPNTYWWAFPTGTMIPAGGFLRVHWFVDRRPNTATDVYTGRHILHFLFGYGGEPLVRSAGGLALLNSVRNTDMNSAGIFRDWVSWGDTGFRRESLAIQARRWIAGQSAPAPNTTESLALDYAAQAEPTPASAFFLDASPTPLRPNTGGASVRRYGNACAVGSVDTPSFQLTSRPVAGNTAFGLRVTNTNGTTRNQSVVFLIGFEALPGTVLPNPFLSCPLWVNPVGELIFVLRAPGNGARETTLPLPLTDIIGPIGPLFLQGYVLLNPPTTTDHGATGGVEITIGR